MTETKRPVAVVTGASGGIGAACARALAADGYDVIVAARRTERIEALAAEIGGRAVTCDVTKAEDVAKLKEAVGPDLDVLVNNAGGALGVETVEHTNFDDWRTMLETNVVAVGAVTQALLPALKHTDHGTVIVIGSTAGQAAYEGGAGYNAAKFGVRAVTDALRLELCGTAIRVCEIAPGMVKSDAFALTRNRGDETAAEKTYAGVDEPLVQEDIAECVRWVCSLPRHVNIERMVVRPVAQAANHKVWREGHIAGCR